MAGITAFGAYVPIHRLSRNLIAEAWGGFSSGGEKAVANFDEDSITMAVAAAQDCIGGMDRQQIDGVYFASTTAPYKEKLSSSLIATALDLRRDIRSADFANTLRAGSNALRAALDAVNGGSAKNVLVTAADCRLGEPGSEFEQSFGDGAAAVLVGDTGVAVSVEGSYHLSDEFLDLWRLDVDDFVNTWESRFVLSQGYNRVVKEAVSEAMKKYGLTAKDFAKAIIYAPDARSQQGMARTLGFDPKAQLQDPLLSTVGHTGCASVLMMLVAALEEAKPGDRILLTSYGDGADVFILRVTDAIEQRRNANRRGIKGHLGSKMMLPHYQRYVTLRNLMDREAARYPSRSLSIPNVWRQSDQLLRFHGCRCRRCSTVQYPTQRVCIVCQAKDDYEEVMISDKKAEVFTFTKDVFVSGPDRPTVVAVINFEGGGRMSCLVTDRDPDALKVGMGVEMTFRRIQDAGHIHQYYWKARPVR